MPTIVLGQDEVDCFAAWVSAEAGLPEHVETGSDLKVVHHIHIFISTEMFLRMTLYTHSPNDSINIHR